MESKRNVYFEDKVKYKAKIFHSGITFDADL